MVGGTLMIDPRSYWLGYQRATDIEREVALFNWWMKGIYDPVDFDEMCFLARVRSGG